MACHGHAASVESVALNGAGDRVASGDWTGGLKLWRASLEGAYTAGATMTSSSKRARKASPTQVRASAPLTHCQPGHCWR